MKTIAQNARQESRQLTGTDSPYLDDYDAGDSCPVHGSSYKKVYEFGSTMSGETEVTTFHGCRCAVSIKHHPAGGDSSAMWHASYSEAAGRGRLHAMEMAAKYR